MSSHHRADTKRAVELNLIDSLQGEVKRLRGEVDRLREDQADWRKGVGLIARAAGVEFLVPGSTIKNLCCVDISHRVLELRAEVEGHTLDALKKKAGEP